jgi:hypothetical protein
VQVAPFDGQRLGPREVLVEGQLAAMPAWAPDGQSLLYMAPGGPNGRFQLWLVQAPRSSASASPQGAVKPSGNPTPVATRQARLVTTDLDLDATSAPLWMAPALS